MENLYQLSNEFLELETLLIASEGEITPEIEAKLVITTTNINSFADQTAFIIKKIEHEKLFAEMQIEKFVKQKKTRETQIEFLKTNLKNAMLLFDVPKIKTENNSLYLKNSEKVVFNEDIEKLDKKILIEVTTTTTIPKAEIKARLNLGEEFIGVEIQKNTSLIIR